VSFHEPVAVVNPPVVVALLSGPILVPDPVVPPIPFMPDAEPILADEG